MSLGHLISGQWAASGGAAFSSTDPASGRMVWQGSSAAEAQIEAALCQAARSSLDDWRSRSLEERIGFLQAFADQVQAQKDEFAETISLETGKPLWESLSEVQAMVGKVALSVQAWDERRAGLPKRKQRRSEFPDLPTRRDIGGTGAFQLARPYPQRPYRAGAVAGNTVVFKPSELTPAVGEKTALMWQASGLPPGVFNLIQGGPETGRLLVKSPAIDGLLFTGSYNTGKACTACWQAIRRNWSPLSWGVTILWWCIIRRKSMPPCMVTILSAFITAGQRCTCARRLIIENNSDGARFSGKGWRRRSTRCESADSRSSPNHSAVR